MYKHPHAIRLALHWVEQDDSKKIAMQAVQKCHAYLVPRVERNARPTCRLH